jgi:hypothetical protein
MKKNEDTFLYSKYKKHGGWLDVALPPFLAFLGYIIINFLKSIVMPAVDSSDLKSMAIIYSLSSLPSLIYIKITKSYAEKIQEDKDFDKYELAVRQLRNAKKDLESANKKAKKQKSDNISKYQEHRRKISKLITYVSCNLSKNHKEEILVIIDETDENIFSFIKETYDDSDVNDLNGSSYDDKEKSSVKLSSDEINNVINDLH